MASDKMIFFKAAELLLACCCLGLHCYSKAGSEHAQRLATGTYVGYVNILLGLTIGCQLKYPVDKRIDMFYTAIGFVLFLASGALYTDTYDGYPKSEAKDKGIATGSLSIITSIVLLADVVLNYRD